MRLSPDGSLSLVFSPWKREREREEGTQRRVERWKRTRETKKEPRHPMEKWRSFFVMIAILEPDQPRATGLQPQTRGCCCSRLLDFLLVSVRRLRFAICVFNSPLAWVIDGFQRWCRCVIRYTYRKILWMFVHMAEIVQSLWSGWGVNYITYIIILYELLYSYNIYTNSFRRYKVNYII